MNPSAEQGPSLEELKKDCQVCLVKLMYFLLILMIQCKQIVSLCDLAILVLKKIVVLVEEVTHKR